MGLPGGYIRQDGDHADAAQGADGNDLVVIAGIDIKAAVTESVRGRQLRHLGDIAAGFLDGYDIFRIPGQSCHGRRQDVGAGSGRDIVNDAGKLCPGRDGPVMGIQAVLGGLVVVRRDQQDRVRAQLFRFFGHHDRVGRIVGAGARDDRSPTFDDLYRPADGLQMFIILQGRRFAGCTADNEGVCVIGQLILDQGLQSVVIDLPVLFHRCDQRHAGSFKNSHFFLYTSYFVSDWTKLVNSCTSSMVFSLTVYMNRPICGQLTGGISSCMTITLPYLSMISSWVWT